MANDDHVAMLKKGVKAWKPRHLPGPRSGGPWGADLGGVNLRRADLRREYHRCDQSRSHAGGKAGGSSPRIDAGRCQARALENPGAPGEQTEAERRDIESAASAFGWQLQVVHAKSAAEFDPVFAALARERVWGTDHRDRHVLLQPNEPAALPAVGPLRDFPAAGGPVSYSTSIPNTYRQVGVYTGKVSRES
jgi:hypothetical protein